MKTFESLGYDDEDGDEIRIDCCDTHVELCVAHSTGAWVTNDPALLREMAEQLMRGAQELERLANS